MRDESVLHATAGRILPHIHHVCNGAVGVPVAARTQRVLPTERLAHGAKRTSPAKSHRVQGVEEYESHCTTQQPAALRHFPPGVR